MTGFARSIELARKSLRGMIVLGIALICSSTFAQLSQAWVYQNHGVSPFKPVTAIDSAPSPGGESVALFNAKMLVKLSATNTILWYKHINIPNFTYDVFTLYVDDIGNIFTGGMLYAYGAHYSTGVSCIARHDAANGNIMWYSTFGPATASGVVNMVASPQGIVFVRASGASNAAKTFRAFNTQTGALLWTNNLASETYVSYAITATGDPICAGTITNSRSVVTRLNAATGVAVWRFAPAIDWGISIMGRTSTGQLVAAGNFRTGSSTFDQYISCLNESNGAEFWHTQYNTPANNHHNNSIIFNGGTGFLGSYSGVTGSSVPRDEMFRFDILTGAVTHTFLGPPVSPYGTNRLVLTSSGSLLFISHRAFT